MAYIQDDFNASGAKDSVFDWGHSSRDSVRSKSNGSSKNSSSNNDDSSRNSIGSGTTSGPTSRYDPSAMSRIVDINDLVDDDDDDDDDSDSDDNVIHNGHRSNNISAKNQKRKSKNRQKLKHQYPSFSYKSPLVGRQVVMLTVLVGIIVAASVAIGYAVMNSDNPDDNNFSGGAPPTKLGGGSEGNDNNDNVARQQQAGVGQQELLEIAEMVIEACSEDALDEDMSQCQSMCHASMCCFEEEEYGCEDEDDVDCAVYGGCQALLVGLEMEDGEEEE